MQFYEGLLNFLGLTPNDLLTHAKLVFIFKLLGVIFWRSIKKLWKIARGYLADKKRVSESMRTPFDVIMLVFVPQKDDLVLAAVVRLQLLR